MIEHVERVKKFIIKENLLQRGDRVLIGVSGGPDSIALLEILLYLKDFFDLQLAVCHVNHKLRSEAEDEARFVENLCEEKSLFCKVFNVNVKAYMEKSSQGLQQAARHLRFDSFYKMYKAFNADRLALAHHADDQAETVLLNLLRGAGPEGLAGIRPERDLYFGDQKMKLIHPLLVLTREDIIQFCELEGLNYCIDRSNLKTDYFRNKIRLKLLPELEDEYNKGIRKRLVQMAEIFRSEEEFWEEQLKKIWSKVTEIEKKRELIIWNLEALRQEKLAVLRRIFRKGVELVKGDLDDIYYYHIEDIIEQVFRGSVNNKINLPGKLQFKLGYERAFLEREKEEQPCTAGNFCSRFSVPGTIRLNQLSLEVTARLVDDYNPEKIPVSRDRVWIDAEKAGFNLLVRNRRPGDRFRPFGMSGSKKLKDFFIDQKVPRNQRDQIPLVCDQEGNIIWVIFYRLDERFKVTCRTRQIVELHAKLLNNKEEDFDA